MALTDFTFFKSGADCLGGAISATEASENTVSGLPAAVTVNRANHRTTTGGELRVRTSGTVLSLVSGHGGTSPITLTDPATPGDVGSASGSTVHGRLNLTVDWAALTNTDTDWPYTHSVPADDVFGPVSSGDRAGGDVEYRCVYIRNNSGGPVTLSISKQSTSYDDFEFGTGTSGIDGVEQTIADKYTAPVGVTFDFLGASIPELADGEWHAFWIARYPISTENGGNCTVCVRATDDADSSFLQFLLLEYSEGGGPPTEAVTEEPEFTDVIPTAELSGELTGDTADLGDAVLGDLIPGGIGAVDYVLVSEVWSGQLELSGEITDSATFSDAVERAYVASAALVENATITDTAAAAGVFGVALSDGLAFVELMTRAGEEYDGWVINADTNAPSFYRWGAFTSLTRFQGRYFGTTADGVFELTGENDDGEDIESAILTGVTDLGIPKNKRAMMAYVGVRASGEMLLKTVVGENVTRVYRMRSTNDSMMQRRVPFGKGVDSVYWQFGLENVDSADFELGMVRVFPVVLGRRFR
jgi:hypothetical protein